MSQSKNAAVHASAAGDLAAMLNGLLVHVAAPSLGQKERRRLQKRNEICPDALIEMLAHLAEQNGGHVLGMPFDAKQARAALTKVSATKTALGIARQLVQRLEDDQVQQRIVVADPAFALFTALRRLVNTETGNKLAPAYAQMKQIVKNRPRKSRGSSRSDANKKAAPAPAATPAKSEPSVKPTA
jgi:hypothetical protein